MVSNDALVLVFLRNAFYRRLHYLALAVFGLCILVIVILISLLVYLNSNPTKPIYFATDNVSRLIQVVPVTTPTISKEELMSWTIEAVEAANSYDYVSYRSQLQNAEKYFTSYGWKQYLKALRTSDDLVGLTARKWLVSTRVIEEPKIIGERLLGGAYAWKLEMPILKTYANPPAYDAASSSIYRYTVSVIVQRQPTLQGYKGLGIVQMLYNQPTSLSDQPRILSGPTG
ncbi:MAG: DotI/IcmL/TraM family protein [Gammaproteobacteria bacterium]|nr:DotI/IcmL/TraM family protein [Gammaproteobacteria bacterium]